MNAYAFDFDYSREEDENTYGVASNYDRAAPRNPEINLEETIASLDDVWRDSIQFYTKLIKSLPHLTDKEMADLFSQASSNTDARNTIVLNNLRLALSKILHDGLSCYNSGRADWEDYLQDCIESLLHTAEAFDYSRGNEFSTYAMSGMKNQISQSIADNMIIRIPKDISNAHHKISIARRKDVNRGKPEATLVNEVLNADGKHSDLVKRYMKYKGILDSRFISLQTPLENGSREESSCNIGTTIKNDVAEKTILSFENKQVLNELIAHAQLDDIEKCILMDKYISQYTMREIAEFHDLSSENEGRNIQQRALRKLRKSACEMNLKYNDLF